MSVLRNEVRGGFDRHRLFKHNIDTHQQDFSYGDISTIEGFLVVVGNKFHNIPQDTPEEKAYRAQTLNLAYEHLKLHLTIIDWPHFKALMGYSDDTVTEVTFLNDSTKKTDEEYSPFHSAKFLIDLEHDPGKTSLPYDSWRNIKWQFQVAYWKERI